MTITIFPGDHHICFATKKPVIPYSELNMISCESVNYQSIKMPMMRNKSQSSLSNLRQSVLAIAQTAPDANRFGRSFRILFQWKASIYKHVWRHMLVYFTCYYSLSIIYAFVLKPYYPNSGKIAFESIGKYCANYSRSVNIIIMLAFFTSTAMQRLFTMQLMMPGTAKIITFYVTALKPGLPEGSIIVEQFARWAVTAWILTFRMVSKPLHNMFPDMISLQRAGILKEKERVILERVETQADSTPRPLICIDWMLLLLKETMVHNRFMEKSSHLKIIEIITPFKKSCGNTIKFATHNIPQALIQASIIAVYLYGFISLMSRGFGDKATDPATEIIINYVPLIPSLQYFIFLAWLNFGRAAVNPFGEDDDDIDIREMLEGHIQNSLRLAKLYSQSLENVFGQMPQHQYNVQAA